MMSFMVRCGGVFEKRVKKCMMANGLRVWMEAAKARNRILRVFAANRCLIVRHARYRYF